MKANRRILVVDVGGTHVKLLVTGTLNSTDEWCRMRPESEAATKTCGGEHEKTLLTVGVATTLMIAWFIGRVQGQQNQSKGQVIFVSAD